ncbi:unnamed protein product [Urochloa humidicola]
MATGGRPVTCCCAAAVLLATALLLSAPDSTEAYDSLDPNGNITIKWDIILWTPDGYVAVVTMFNYQQFRHIGAPGWQLGWTWAKKEVIWSMVGAQTTEQGDCSKFLGNTPHSCKKDPTIVDLLPDTPYNMQITNCCKAGVLSTFNQDPANAAASFQLSVGLAGTTTKTVKLPKRFTLKTPGPGYTCGRAIVGKSSMFFSADGRRASRALMTWNVTCTYSQFLAQKTPSCCVSLSSSYNDTTVDCPTCSCGCQNPNRTNCVNKDSPHLRSAWGAGINDTAMFWGVKPYNDVKLGSVQGELLIRKDSQTFTFEKGWAFPRRVYFNGDNCVMPAPESYPSLPHASPSV